MNQPHRFFLLFLLILTTRVALAGLPDFSGLQDDDEFLPVAEAFKARVEAAGDGWKVHFDIADGYYLYRDRIHASNPDARIHFLQASETKLDKNFGRVEIFHHQLDLTVTGNDLSSLSYQGCSEHQLCYPPQTLALDRPLNDINSQNASQSSNSNDLFSGHNFWWVVFTFAGLGLGLAFTPCVFPMIPILSSIIAGQSRQNLTASRGLALSLSYVTGMATSYALIGALVAAFGARLNISGLTQMPAVIILAALLFVVLALAMFGLFELQLPSALRQRLDGISSRQQGGQLFSTWLMGFFASLVVSPCVSAPLAGALVYLSTTGDVLTGGAALFALGMGMGIPLLAIGISGGRFLPRAGRWMLFIRSAFGVALLGVALALLARLIDMPTVMGLAGMLAIGVAVFLGVLERPGNPLQRLGSSLGLICLLTGALWIAGAARNSSDWLHPLASTDPQVTSVIRSAGPAAVYEDVSQLMNAITGGEDPRPVVLDIYADWCTSCAEMDELLNSPDSRAALAPYRMLRLDMTRSTSEQRRLLAELNIFGPPALQKYSHNGNAIGTALQGLPAQSELLGWLGRPENDEPASVPFKLSARP